MKFLSLLLFIFAIAYSSHLGKKVNAPVKTKETPRLTPTISHPKDWSVMVAVWMETCHQFHLNLLKIDPKTGLDFVLYLQGYFPDFQNWLELSHSKLPAVHWQEITIYHGHNKNLNFKLHGAYYENH